MHEHRPTPLPADSATRRIAPGDEARVAHVARRILGEFESYYRESRGIPRLAQQAFEARDPSRSFALSRRRLSMYSESIDALGSKMKSECPELAIEEGIWDEVMAAYVPAIRGRYEADLAFAYAHSVRRRIHQGEWKPVEYAFGDAEADRPPGTLSRVFPCGGAVPTATIREILAVPSFAVPFEAVEADAEAVAARVNAAVFGASGAGVERIEMIDAGFFRNRGAYLVGRVITGEGRLVPFVIALLNGEHGIRVDAVLTSEADAHNIFSSTLANFHVTSPRYHELAAFLHTVMPERPLGLHYSTIGFNHVGKVAVMSELKSEIATTGEVLDTSVGFRGTVAIGFATPGSEYNLKVIRDTPTDQYKWGEFEGVASVLAKYGRVHDINRTGSMLDNIIYYNVKLERDWFAPALLDELLDHAGGSVSMHAGAVVFKHLIVQRRQTPLPVFLETASREEAEIAVINLGHCIKNNAAANIFNRDLDGRNYGVSRFLKVYLYDYDALVPFTDVKIRTNLERFDGEEDPPDWYYEDGVVFLPEEIESGLRIPDRALRRVFREHHGDLLTPVYWEAVQADLRAGNVPPARIYPESAKIDYARTFSPFGS